MTFNSIPFIILFPAAVLVYRLIPQKIRYAWLLVCSIAFYCAAGTGYIAVLAATVVVVYLLGLALYAFDGRAAKNACLLAGLIIILSTLFIFKYLDFTLGLFGSALRFNLLLPVGISFYSFMAVSYLIDVYRGNTPAEKNIIKLALYL